MFRHIVLVTVFILVVPFAAGRLTFNKSVVWGRNRTLAKLFTRFSIHVSCGAARLIVIAPKRELARRFPLLAQLTPHRGMRNFYSTTCELPKIPVESTGFP
jgi:hypothetical protein